MEYNTQPREHTVGKTAEGVVTVDGREYPMAAELVATESVIHKSIREIAQRIADDYRHLTHRDTHSSNATDGATAPISDNNPLIVLSILKGSYIFTADLTRYLNDCGLPHVVDFFRATSYRGTTKSSGTVSLLEKPRFVNLEGKHVLIVEDICDTGRTLDCIIKEVREIYRPASLKLCVLADKPGGRLVPVPLDYVCLTVPNQYVIGYGFEVNDRYRNFRHIFTLRPDYAKRFPSQL
ncbi:Phosphoribosyl transferase domain [Trypanosoma vivax]|uniref:Putative hypoxanthine-guanine phosphoribosyltransferase n=1 Tax=Trypanosoma vivax (strain Y486) TaxID=1055687 RepID=G0U5D5_TRYVY|nr:putative hypoxanthine-guanine phosphoribosyltransferase [Trypanosoma vivax]KAH8618398.1 Phosphoribosyl transferase domain [Trypanosoma vivax]CCC51083.1 putative hypoxanthine-guanine phosphoribosyltransferase [Trypanosoma vivax Y486]